jgi:hypothetical protein
VTVACLPPPPPPPFDLPAGAASATAAAGFVAALVRDGLAGPVFVVATDESVGAAAPVWAEAFARIGWRHRVRVLAPIAEGAEIADVAAEIVGFGAGVIVVAAGPDVVAAVRRMAGAEGPPVAVWPACERPAEGNAAPAD